MAIGLSKSKAQSAGERKTLNIQLSFFKKEDLSKQVTGRVLSKDNEEKTVPVIGIPVDFYTKDGGQKEILFQTTTTDHRGKFSISLPPNLVCDTGNYFDITARIHNEKLYEDAEESLHWKEADIRMEYNHADTSQRLTVFVTERSNTNSWIAAKNVPVGFFIKRMFGNVPAAEEYTVNTNESGEASFTYPPGIPGDVAGNIVLVARIVDNETYGTVEKKATAKWGTVLAAEKDPFPRALWEPRPPMPLVITISLLFGGVWFVYFFIFYQLKKISTSETNTIK
jgi:hypothetical protein